MYTLPSALLIISQSVLTATVIYIIRYSLRCLGDTRIISAAFDGENTYAPASSSIKIIPQAVKRR